MRYWFFVGLFAWIHSSEGYSTAAVAATCRDSSTNMEFHSKLSSQNPNSKKEKQDSSKSKIKFSVSGSINVGIWYQSINSSSLQRKTLEWFLQGQPTIALNGYTFPFSGVYSNNEFNYTQPFNQIGISPKIKNFTAHLGYRNLAFLTIPWQAPPSLAGALNLILGN